MRSGRGVTQRPARAARSGLARACDGRASAAFEQLEQRLVFSGPPALGISLDAVVDYSTAWPFADAFQTSRPWFSNAYNTVTKQEIFSDIHQVITDAAGWPTTLQSWTNDQGQLIQQRTSTLMFREIGDKYPAGVYHAQWEGTGAVSFSGAGQVINQGKTADGKSFADVRVTPNETGVWFKINSTDPADPIRNAHFWMPDYDSDGDGVADQPITAKPWTPKSNFSPFHPEFINRLKPFKVLRFMDWADTNGTTLVSWDQRPHYNDARQSVDGKGVAYEYMIALCNEVGADMWLNIPHSADARFVNNLAQLVASQLKPGLKVYLEYSNEVWNYAGGFDAFYWISDQLAKPENASYNGDRWKFEADQIKNDFDIFSTVFGAAGQQDRLVRVVAGQASNRWVTEQILLNMEGKFDAISCSGYFGLSDSQRATFDADTTSDQIVRAILDNASGAMSGLRQHKELVDSYSKTLGRQIKLVAYEAGQHADARGQNVPWLAALFAAQTDPLMYEAYDDFLRGAYELGVDEITHFTFTSEQSKYGSWGALTYQNEPIDQAPKYKALVDASTGYLYRPEYAVEARDRFINEFGESSGSFRIYRTGDKTVEQDVAFNFSGQANLNDVQPLPTTIHFAAGEVSKLVTVSALEDDEIEGPELLTLTLAPAPDYKVDYKRGSASLTINDDDQDVVWGVPLTNPSFETGDFSGWSLAPVQNNKAQVVSKVTSGAPTNPRNGSNFVWGAGAGNNIGGGANPAGVSQRVDLSAHSERIDWGFATLSFSGWGAGEGPGGDYSNIQILFYDANGKQLGATVASNNAASSKSWTRMEVRAAVPVGARSADVRVLTNRQPTGGQSNSGFDDISGQLTYSLLPTVQVSAGPDATEGGPPSSFTFTRGGPEASDELVVRYVYGGTTSESDHSLLPGSVVIPAGQTSVVVPVTALDDDAYEPTESLVVAISADSAYSVGPAAVATMSILDNDPLPAVQSVRISSSRWNESFKAAIRAAGAGDDGFDLAQVADATLPWTNLDQISVRFTTPVEASLGSLHLSGGVIGELALSDYSYNAQTQTATWTLAQPISSGRMSLALSTEGPDAITDEDGTPLDGEWTGSAPSGDGAPGGDFRLTFNVLPGDVTRNAAVNALDLVALRNRVGVTFGSATYSIFSDVDGDGAINAIDLALLRSRLSTQLPTEDLRSA